MGVLRFQSKITLYPQRMKSICSTIHIQRSKPDGSPFALSSTLSLVSTQAPPYRLTSPSHPSRPFYSSPLISSPIFHPHSFILNQNHKRKTYNVIPLSHTHTFRVQFRQNHSPHLFVIPYCIYLELIVTRYCTTVGSRQQVQRVSFFFGGGFGGFWVGVLVWWCIGVVVC